MIVLQNPSQPMWLPGLSSTTYSTEKNQIVVLLLDDIVKPRYLERNFLAIPRLDPLRWLGIACQETGEFRNAETRIGMQGMPKHSYGFRPE